MTTGVTNAVKPRQYCAMPRVPERPLGPNVNPDRAQLIRMNEKKWVNGTVLHYYFFDKTTDGENVVRSDGGRDWKPWTTTDSEKAIVRKAFEAWKTIGIGLNFEEVRTRQEAEIRIGFMRDDGAWSFVGRDILGQGSEKRTMNFGWDLTRDPGGLDTAMHEIGHTLGFPHEHQNPNAGIVWDEEAVYRILGGAPNFWPRETTLHNIIRKIQPDTVQGSNWDANSVMHYPFEPGMIREPAQFRNGIRPAGGLSERDKTWVKTFYPPISTNEIIELKPAQSVPLSLKAGEQKNFVIKPSATRKYDFSTFGAADTVIVLFEDDNGTMRYITADDDSGDDRNAKLQVKLFSGRKYVLRVRIYYSDRPAETSVMMW
jgi:Astacin (Peptidase family M12A)